MALWIFACTGILLVWIPMLSGSVPAGPRTLAANGLASLGFVVLTLVLARMRRRSK